MKSLESGHVSYFLIDLGVIFHGAAAQRIETGVNTEIHLGKIGVVADNIHLAYLRQRRSLSPKQACWNSGGHRPFDFAQRPARK